METPKGPLSQWTEDQVKYYQYERPTVHIYWNGKEQPTPGFHSLWAAIQEVERLVSMDGNRAAYSIHLPYIGRVNYI